MAVDDKNPGNLVVGQFGTPSRMLRRNSDPVTSHIGAEQHDSAVSEELVFDVIKSFGAKGCISDDVQEALGINKRKVAYSSVTGPYVNLERKFFIIRPGETRVGHRFKLPQLVMYALSDEERMRRITQREALAKGIVTEEDMELVQKWYESYLALCRAVEVEEMFREPVISRFFPDAVHGKNHFNFPSGGRLVYTVRRQGRNSLEPKKTR